MKTKTETKPPAKRGRVATWFRRLVMLFLVGVLILVVVGGVMYRKARRVPDWYVQAKRVDTAQADAVLDQRIGPVENWIGRNTSGNLAAKSPADKFITLALTDEQINMLLAKWTDDTGIRDRLDSPFENVRVRIADGAMTIAGFAKDYGVVCSIILRTQTGPDGKVQIICDSLRVGDVSVPLMLLSSQRAAFEDQLAEMAASYSRYVAIDSRGVATSQTEVLYYNSVLANLLAGEPADFYVFARSRARHKDIVTTRVRETIVESGKMTLTLELLSADQRAKLVDELRSLAKSAGDQPVNPGKTEFVPPVPQTPTN